ncbi:MAG TPA: hypothetical protein VFU31_01610 [Candidatus Binatia bacterium]|nr:hypothetical protein [Candidatus Binatia bacterium]
MAPRVKPASGAFETADNPAAALTIGSPQDWFLATVAAVRLVV